MSILSENVTCACRKLLKTEGRWRVLVVYILLTAALILSFIIRFWPLRIAYWWDETVYLQNAEVLLSGTDNYNELYFRPPLLSIILALVFNFIHNVFIADIVIAFISTLTPLFVFLIGKKLYGLKTGAVAFLIIAFNPFIVENSHYIMTDVPALSFICISFYFLVNDEKNIKNTHYIFSGVFLSLAVLTRFTSLILLLVFSLWIYINVNSRNQQARFKKIILLLSGFGIGIFPYLVWAQITYGSFLKPFIMATLAITDVNEPLTFYLIKFLEVYPYIILLGLILRIISFMFFRSENSKEKIDIKNLRVNYLDRAEIVFLVWILLFFVYITITPHKELRYMLPLALPLTIISSRGIVYFIENKKILIRYLFILLITLIFVQSTTLSFSKLKDPPVNTYKTDEMKISEFIRANYPGDTRIYTNHNYPVFAYYSKKKTTNLLPYDESFYSEFPENMKEKGLLIAYNEIKHPTADWLDKNKHFKKVTQLNNINVYEYTP